MVISLARKLHDQDRVLAGQAHQNDQPDLDEGVVVAAEQLHAGQRRQQASSTLRYYEKLGLIASEREGSSESEHRRYRESTFLKIRYITIGQRAGFSLEEIAAQLATLPDRFPLPKKDWAPMSRVWDERIDQRIAELKKLKIDIVNCTCGRTKASAGGR